MDDKFKSKKQSFFIVIGICFIVINLLGLMLGGIALTLDDDNIITAFIELTNYLNNSKMPPLAFNSNFSILLNLVFLVLSANAYTSLKETEKMRPGEEHGSSTWFKDYKNYNKKYVEKDYTQNMIFTKEVKLSMDTHKTRKNCNTLVIGGSGTGKSRFFVKPNVLQANCSFVMTDPSGELLRDEGNFLKNQGYNRIVFNLVDPNQSSHYNPFHYIRNEEGVLEMINCLIQNTNNGKSSSDPFWEKSETAFLLALCFYLRENFSEKEQNFSNVIKLINKCEVRENDPDFKNAVDILMDELEEKNPDSMAVANWKIFKLAPGKTAMSILVSAGVRLNVFNMPSIKKLTDTDDIHLETIGDKKTGLFVVIPSADKTFNFMVSMMYSQLFSSLYYRAEHNPSGTLDIPVRFMLDEFCNIGQIPDFCEKLSTMRKYEISCSIIIQSLPQLQALFDKSWEVIVDNCDNFLFLGNQGATSIEYVSKKLGQQTIKTDSRSRNVGGKSGGGSKSIQSSGRDLMTSAEISQMTDDNCIYFLRGLKPFFCHKFPLEKHPNFNLSGDGNKELKYFYKKEHPEINDKSVNKKETDLRSKPSRKIKNTSFEQKSSQKGVELWKPKDLSETCKEIAVSNKEAKIVEIKKDEFITDKPPIMDIDISQLEAEFDTFKQKETSIVSDPNIDKAIENMNFDYSSMLDDSILDTHKDPIDNSQSDSDNIPLDDIDLNDFLNDEEFDTYNPSVDEKINDEVLDSYDPSMNEEIDSYDPSIDEEFNTYEPIMNEEFDTSALNISDDEPSYDNEEFDEDIIDYDNEDITSDYNNEDIVEEEDDDIENDNMNFSYDGDITFGYDDEENDDSYDDNDDEDDMYNDFYNLY